MKQEISHIIGKILQKQKKHRVKVKLKNPKNMTL